MLNMFFVFSSSVWAEALPFSIILFFFCNKIRSELRAIRKGHSDTAPSILLGWRSAIISTERSS